MHVDDAILEIVFTITSQRRSHNPAEATGSHNSGLSPLSCCPVHRKGAPASKSTLLEDSILEIKLIITPEKNLCRKASCRSRRQDGQKHNLQCKLCGPGWTTFAGVGEENVAAPKTVSFL
mmetsp:Transcript_71751/g.131376  ORF Transcript_71751/g.131376 Transcript_71751/m.131376 type:complete len:120 (-) Transcript_71751:159-518(-)